MFREQTINFLEAVVVLLTPTNAAGVVAAAYARSIAHGPTPALEIAGDTEFAPLYAS